jgi:TonB family protein
MIRWLSKALFCVWLLTGCSTQNTQPVTQPLETSATNDNTKVKVTQFSNYDAALVERIQNQWYKELDSGKFELDRIGKVVILFRLHSDGTISDLKISKNSVSHLLGFVCVKAIKNSAPFPKWPPEMVKKLGLYVDVQFTFDYYPSEQKSLFRSLFNW